MLGIGLDPTRHHSWYFTIETSISFAARDFTAEFGDILIYQVELRLTIDRLGGSALPSIVAFASQDQREDRSSSGTHVLSGRA